MRKILRDTCILAALIILTVFTFSIVTVGVTAEIILVFQIFGLALVLSVLNYLFDEKTSYPMLISYLIKYFAVSIIVIAFGFIVGWFFASNFWMAFIYVGVITVVVYALDSVKTENDIEEINEMVMRSKNEAVQVTPLKKKHGWKVLLVLLSAMIILCIASSAGYVISGGKGDIAGYLTNGMAVTAIAAVSLALILLIYLIIDNNHRKKTA